jgi:hypothetical protein
MKGEGKNFSEQIFRDFSPRKFNTNNFNISNNES